MKAKSKIAPVTTSGRLLARLATYVSQFEGWKPINLPEGWEG